MHCVSVHETGEGNGSLTLVPPHPLRSRAREAPSAARGEGKGTLRSHPGEIWGRPTAGWNRRLTFRGTDHYVPLMDGPGAPRPENRPNNGSKKTSVVGTIALIVVLFGLLIAATLFAVRSWTSVEGPPMPEVGYVAMTIGVVFSLLIGIALMALLFYSSRHGYDERASGEAHTDGDGEPQ